MTKLTKNKKIALGKIETGKQYSLVDASKLVKDITTTKFDSSVDIDVRLGVDPRKANQMVRGIVTYLMEQVKLHESWYFAHQIKLMKLLLQVQIMPDLKNILKK